MPGHIEAKGSIAYSCPPYSIARPAVLGNAIWPQLNDCSNRNIPPFDYSSSRGAAPWGHKESEAQIAAPGERLRNMRWGSDRMRGEEGVSARNYREMCDLVTDIYLFLEPSECLASLRP